MTHFLRLILLSVMLCAIVTPAVAQSENFLEKYQQTANERDNLSERVKQLEKQLKEDTTRLNKKLEVALKQQKEQYENQIKELKKDTTAKAKVIIALKKDLEKQIGDKSQKTVDGLKNQISDLEKDTLQLKQSLRAHEKELADAKSSLDAMEKELVQLRPFRKQMLAQALTNANQWATVPFSTLDPSQLEKLLRDCREYGGGDAQFKDAASKIQLLLSELTQYREANDLLNHPYNEQQIKKSRQNLQQLMSKYAGKPQLSELEAVDVLLRDYDGNIYMFQELIADLDKEIEQERLSQNSNGAKEMLKLALSDKNQIDRMSSINTVPYLAKLLKRYLDDLAANPIAHSAVEQELNKMIP